jgi:hypothetical protein
MHGKVETSGSTGSLDKALERFAERNRAWPVGARFRAGCVLRQRYRRPLTADTPSPRNRGRNHRRSNRLRSVSYPALGVWLAADVSESKDWTLYRERATQFASSGVG